MCKRNHLDWHKRVWYPCPMTTMQSELYDALVSAGADEAKARRAAEEAADRDRGFDRIERRIDSLHSDLGKRIDSSQSTLERRIDSVNADLSGQISLLRWMFGALVGGVAAIMIKLFV